MNNVASYGFDRCVLDEADAEPADTFTLTPARHISSIAIYKGLSMVNNVPATGDLGMMLSMQARKLFIQFTGVGSFAWNPVERPAAVLASQTDYNGGVKSPCDFPFFLFAGNSTCG